MQAPGHLPPTLGTLAVGLGYSNIILLHAAGTWREVRQQNMSIEILDRTRHSRRSDTSVTRHLQTSTQVAGAHIAMLSFCSDQRAEYRAETR